MKDEILLKDLDLSTNENLVEFLLSNPLIILFEGPEDFKIYKENKHNLGYYAYPLFAEKGLFKVDEVYNDRTDYISKYNFRVMHMDSPAGRQNIREFKAGVKYSAYGPLLFKD